MKSNFVVTLCIGGVAAATVLLAGVCRNGDRPSGGKNGPGVEGNIDGGGGAGEDSSVGKALEDMPRGILETAETTNSGKDKAGSLSQSEGDGRRIPRVGERISDDMRKSYATKLLAAGFQEASRDTNTYLATGLSLETVKNAIAYDEAIGSMGAPPGGLACGVQVIILEMPYIHASVESSTIFTNKPTKIRVVIYDKACDPKAKPDGANLKKELHLHRNKPGGTGTGSVEKTAVP
jgi:hypothetical protein